VRITLRNLYAIRLIFAIVCFSHAAAWAVLDGWPYPGYNHVDFDHPLGLVDSSVIPVVNTCLEPMQIQINQSGVTGGVLATGIGQPQGCNLYPWRGQWYEVIATVPYTLTCGNGVKYAGENRITATGTLKEGICINLWERFCQRIMELHGRRIPAKRWIWSAIVREEFQFEKCWPTALERMKTESRFRKG